MDKEYLPSKKFIVSVATIVIGVSLIFGIYKLVIFIKNKVGKGKSPTALIVKDLVEKDANENGIPDWEESLWGLDPTKSGSENKEFILAKRATIAKAHPELVDNTKPVSENEALSRDFFSIIMSLQQGNALDQTSIQAVSEAIGKDIEAEPIADIYTRKTVKVVESNPNTISDYYGAFINLVIEYSDKNIGDELTFINQGLQNNDPKAIKEINSISKAYKAFGAEFIKVPVPNTLVNTHISLANNYEKVGQIVANMTDLLGNPLNGIKSFINYKKYSDALTDDVDKLTADQ
ncbi:MAG: hypothetical protein AAB477_00225 [Patescibacteria group bacterium]